MAKTHQVAESEESLAEAIQAFIACGDDEKAFDTLAKRLFAYQYVRNLPYRRFCTARGVSPETVVHWTQIPPAPTSAFKRHILSCTQPAEAVRVFHSSGTTGRATSRHFLSAAALRLYEASLRAAFQRFVLPDGACLPIWALMPPPEDAPHSSLSYMLGALMAADPHPDHRFFWDKKGLDVSSLARALEQTRTPVLLFGTAFAWVIFFDSHPLRVTLPEGSRVLETGGFKGRSREIARHELYALFTERLGIPPTHCLAEYGMAELCSQFYDTVLLDLTAGRNRPRRKAGPPWTRTRVIDPRTGEPSPLGEPGLLCHYDLANLNSVCAVCTEDWGCQYEEGFELLGRAPGAALRGCSLIAEEWQVHG